MKNFIFTAFLFNLICSISYANESYINVKTQFVTVGGKKIAYRKQGKQTGTPLFLLMHTRGNMDGWDPELLDTLAKNRTIIAFDNRGVGLSEGDAPADFASMADDAALIITALGYKKVDLLGFSIGGAIAQELMFKHSSLIRKAILAGTSASGGSGVNQMSEKSKAVSTKKELTDEDILYAFFAPSEKSQKMGREFLSRIKKRNSGNDNPVSMDTVKAQAEARELWGKLESKNDERLKKLEIPVLIANGKDDIRMPTINSYALFNLLPNAQLVLYPDSGHGFLFQYPKLCAQNFESFLNQ